MKIIGYMAHTGYSTRLAKALNHDFYMINKDCNWDTFFGEKPNNVLLNAGRNGNYDLAIVHNKEQAKDIKTFFTGPMIGITHGFCEYDGMECIPDALVFLCKRNSIGVDHPKKVIIPHYVEFPYSYNYNGNIPIILTVANNLFDRTELMPEFYDDVTKHFPRIIIGGSNVFRRGSIGMIKNSIVLGFMENLRLLLYTPTVDCGMGYNNMEAMASGMPVVTTDFADWKEYIQNGISGFISNDVTEMRDYIDQLMKNIEYAKYVGLNGRKIIYEHFNIGIYRDKWDSLIKELTS